MSASNKKNFLPFSKKPSRKSGEAQDDIVRFAMDAKGHILYASDEFSALCQQTTDELKDQDFTDHLSFTEPDEALRSHALFGNSTENYINLINEGVHEVFIGNKQGLMQFDKITASNNKQYIIGSLVNSDRIVAMDKSFTQQILKTLAVEKKKPTQKPSGSPVETDSDLRNFLNMSNEMMAISSDEGLFERVNPSINNALGYSDEELHDMNFIDIVHADDRALVRNCLMNVIHDEREDDQIIDFEARILGKDGRILWTEWRQKRSGSKIYSVGRDVTAIQKQEATLREQRQQLEEAQAIGHMGHWRWEVGAEDIVWSDEIYRIFGVNKDEFETTLDNVNALLHKRDFGRLLQAFQRAIIEQNNYDMEFRITQPGGELRFIRCEGKCEKDENDEVTALFGIMQDITPRTLHEQDLQEAKEAAERAYAAKSQFLANMSHELRTPLNAIIGFSEMMQRQLLGPIGTEKYLDYIAGIRESGEHLLDLISDILDMSKIEAGKYELDLEEINVTKVIKLAVHMMEGRAREGEIRIHVKAPNDGLHIVADRRGLMQILLNLLSNAVKFTEAGGQVHVESIEHEDYLSLRIEDDGIGIPAHKIRDITRPFEQAASHYTREHEGTGLGLAITKDLINLHGGTLNIESTLGQGTIVTVRLPYNTYEYLKSKNED